MGFINLCLSGGKAKNQDGLIGSIAVGVSSSVGLTFGKTYYFQLTGKDAFFNNLSTFIQTMNDYAKAKLDLFRTVAGIVL